jgi:putative hydrolase of the HAD superfamily
VREIKAAIFDFDGTIIDTETMWYDIFTEVLLRDYDFQLSLEEFVKCVGISDTILYDYIEKELGDRVDIKALRNVIQERHHQIKDSLEVREGILDMLESFKQKGFKIGLASSSTLEWVQPFLERFEIAHYFETIKTKDDVKKVKPDPELYFKALEDLGVQPEEAVAIEDSVNGSNAAIAAGMTCIVIPNLVTAHLTFHEKCKVYEKVSELALEDLYQ